MSINIQMFYLCTTLQCGALCCSAGKCLFFIKLVTIQITSHTFCASNSRNISIGACASCARFGGVVAPQILLLVSNESVV